MNSSAPLDFKPDLALWSLLTFGVLLGVLILVLSAVRRSSQPAQVTAKFFVLGAVLLAIIVLGTFTRRTGPIRPQEIPMPIKDPPVLRPVSVAGPSSSGNLSASSSDVETNSVKAEAESNKPDVQLPEWTRQSTWVAGANTFVVVKSGRFATLEEAELHAFDEAGQAAARHYRPLDPSGVGGCASIQRELVRQQAIRDRFEEISRHDFGAMKDYPMHQVWLRVELSPQLGQRFAEPWRQVAVAARLRALTGWSVWGTAAAALIAFALRLDAAWNGRRRGIIVGTAAALMLGSLVFLA